MTEAAQEAAPKPKRKSRAKDNSVAIMKELTGLMGQRTAILNQLRAKKAEVAQLESSLQELATEIQWRASVFGLATSNGAQPPISLPGGATFTPGYPGQPQPVMGVAFRQPEPPVNTSGVNRGHADLGALV